MKSFLLCFIGLSLSFGLHARELGLEEINEKIYPLVESGEFVGLSLYLIQGSREYTIHIGEKKIGTHETANDQSLYDIASITKVFAGTALAKAIHEGKIRESDLAQNYLDYTLPTKDSVGISVLDLATHRSGFSQNFMDGVTLKDSLNPWDSFGLAQLLEFFKRSPLEWVPGTKARYDNIGSGILGDILEKVYKKKLEEVFKDEISNSMGLEKTKLHLGPEDLQQKVQAYALLNGERVECPHWTFGSLAAMGGLKSNLSDMAKFARFILKAPNEKWAQIIEIAQRPLRESLAMENESIGLLWRHVGAPYNMDWHNGGTYGMSSFIGINRQKEAALLLLANNYTNTLTGLGFDLMRKINE